MDLGAPCSGDGLLMSPLLEGLPTDNVYLLSRIGSRHNYISICMYVWCMYGCMYVTNSIRFKTRIG